MSSAKNETARVPFVDWLTRRLQRQGTQRLFGCSRWRHEFGSDRIGSAQRHAISIDCARGRRCHHGGRHWRARRGAWISILYQRARSRLGEQWFGIGSVGLGYQRCWSRETFGPGELDYVSHQVFDQAAAVAPLLAEGGGEILGDSVESSRSSSGSGRHHTHRGARRSMFPTGAALRAEVHATSTQRIGPVEPISDHKDLAIARKLPRSEQTPDHHRRARSGQTIRSRRKPQRLCGSAQRPSPLHLYGSRHNCF